MGQPIELSIEDVIVGDILIIRPGASIPVDAEVISGFSAVDESMLTGEAYQLTRQKATLFLQRL